MYGDVTIAHKKSSLERVIRDLVANKDYDKIKKIIQQLCNDFAYAVHQPHARNGGLIGLAAAAIALGPVCRQFLLLWPLSKIA